MKLPHKKMEALGLYPPLAYATGTNKCYPGYAPYLEGRNG